MAACKDVQAGLDRYLDNEMAAEERPAVEAHLAGCPECRTALVERRAAMGLLAQWAASGAETRGRAPIRSAAGWLRLTAAAAALALAASVAWQYAGKEPPVVPAAVPAKPKLVMRTLDQGVTIVRGEAGEPDELIVEAFPLTWRSLSSGVEVVSGKSGEPVELVVDPFPEEGR